MTARIDFRHADFRPVNFRPVDLPHNANVDRAVHRVREAARRLNEAVRRLVAAGASVERIRASRQRGGTGTCGGALAEVGGHTVGERRDRRRATGAAPGGDLNQPGLATGAATRNA